MIEDEDTDENQCELCGETDDDCICSSEDLEAFEEAMEEQGVG